MYDAWRWTRFTQESGLPSNAILNLLDLPGQVPWVLTRTGLAWYDGYRWVSPPADTLTAAHFGRGVITADSAGLLLVVRPWLFHVDTTGYRKIPLEYGGRSLAVERAARVRGEGIVIQCDSVLYLLRGGRIEQLPSPYDHPLTHTVPEHPFGIIPTAAGTVWLSAPAGLYRRQDSRWVLRYAAERGYPVPVSLVENAEGVGVASLRIGSSQERCEWDPNGTFRVEQQQIGDAAISMAIDPNTNVIAVHNSGGFYARTNGRWETVFPPPPDMLSATLLRYRPNGDLWVGKASGLSLCRLSSTLWQVLVLPGQSGHNSVNDLMLAADGTLWVATSAGLLQYRGQRLVQRIENVLGRRLNVITGLAQDQRGDIWISSGADFGGAYRWDGVRWKHFGSMEGLSDNCIHRIQRDPAGRLWFMTIGHEAPGLFPDLEDGAYLYDGKGFEHIGTRAGLPDGRVYAVAHDSTGSVWFGTLKGLARWKGNTWKYWRVPEGLKANRVFTITVDRGNRVWFGHQNQGLAYIDSAGVPRYISAADGLPSLSIWDLEIDTQGRLWVATRDGVGIHHDGSWRFLTTREGLPSPYTWPLLQIGGAMYIGTTRTGVIQFNTEQLDSLSPAVYFRESVEHGSTVQLSWDAYAPWGAMPADEILTRHRIDEESWSIWSTDRSISRTDLSPGEHTLEVQAQGMLAAVGGRGHHWKFEVLLPWYLRPAFLIPLVSLVLLLVALAIVLGRRKREYLTQLHERDARYRAVVEQQSELIARVVPEGRLSFVNDALCKFVRRSREQIIGRPFLEVFAGGESTLPLETLWQPSGPDFLGETDHAFSDAVGRNRWLRWTAYPILDAKRRVSEVQLIGRDITERRSAEMLLLRSEERYRIVAEQTGQLVYDYDVPTGKISWYGAITDVTGFTTQEFQRIAIQDWEEMIHPEDRTGALELLARAMREVSRYRVEYRFRHKDSTYVNIFDNGVFLEGPDGEAVRMLGTMTNITDRKRAEEQIAASLGEKEILLKEIHHRVKNNLQVVSSLLHLQSSSVENPHVLEVLRESQNRIRSMALIHERLYQSRNLARIDMDDYIRSLAGSLVRSYDASGVRLSLKIANISLPLDTAIPCGLIINELLTNALKHAFQGSQKGEVEVRVELLRADTVLLTVRDSGTGFPADVDFQKTTTLGMQLVNTLTAQINGTIGLVHDQGTTFSITFPLER